MKFQIPLLSALMGIANLLFVSSVMAEHVIDRAGTMVEDEHEIEKLAEEAGIEPGALDLMKKYNVTEDKLKELLNIDAEDHDHAEDHAEEQPKEIVQLSEPAETAEPPKKESRLKIGGAIRASYVYGDYNQTPSYADSGPALPGDRRGRNVGAFMFDTFRVNVGLNYGNVIGDFEYRWWWYLKNAGYSSLSRAWLGYDFGDGGTLKVGVVRVPFGPGPFGISSSWFFDQHFYVGLADDRDTGIRWTNTFDNLTLDLAYYLQAQPHGEGGTSRDSVRYDYDVAKWDVIVDPTTGRADFPGFNEGRTCDCGYEEQHQFNVRAIYAVDNIGEFGASFQYGMLKGTNIPDDDDDGTHYAFSAHAKNPFGDFTLYSQLTYYEYDITDNTPWGTGDLIPMGGYDFAWLTASRGWIPAINLRYTGIDTSAIWPDWLESLKPDSITPYVEWSSITKLANVPMNAEFNAGSAFNDSSLWVIGASWSRGGWFNYLDLAISNGNGFVGNEFGSCNFCNIYDTGGTFGANKRGEWQKRLNINFGYYF